MTRTSSTAASPSRALALATLAALTLAVAGCASPRDASVLDSMPEAHPTSTVPGCATTFVPPRSTTDAIVLLSTAHRDASGRSLPADEDAWPVLPSQAAIPLELAGPAGTSELSGGVDPGATTYLIRDGRTIGTSTPARADRERFDLGNGWPPHLLPPAALTTCSGGEVAPGDYDVYASVTLQVTGDGLDDQVVTGGPWRVHVDDALAPLPTTPAEALACGASIARLAASADPYRAELTQNQNIELAPGSPPYPQILLRPAHEDRGTVRFLDDLTLESVAAAVVRDDVVVAMTTTQEHLSEGFDMIGKVDLTFPATMCDGSTLPDGPVDVVTAIEVAHRSTGEHDLVVSNHWQTTVPLY